MALGAAFVALLSALLWRTSVAKDLFCHLLAGVSYLATRVFSKCKPSRTMLICEKFNFIYYHSLKSFKLQKYTICALYTNFYGRNLVRRSKWYQNCLLQMQTEQNDAHMWEIRLYLLSQLDLSCLFGQFWCHLLLLSKFRPQKFVQRALIAYFCKSFWLLLEFRSEKEMPFTKNSEFSSEKQLQITIQSYFLSDRNSSRELGKPSRMMLIFEKFYFIYYHSLKSFKL